MKTGLGSGNQHAAEADNVTIRLTDGELNRTTVRRKRTEVDDNLKTRRVAAHERGAEDPADASITLAKGPKRTRRGVDTLNRIEARGRAGRLRGRQSNGEDDGHQSGKDSGHTQGYRPGAGAAGDRDRKTMDQEERRALHGNLSRTIELARELYAKTVGANEATQFSIQRAVILPGMYGHAPRFRIGSAKDAGGSVTEVQASEEIDVYLEYSEPCPDCGGQIERGTDRGPEHVAGDLICARCGSLFSEDPERWLEWAAESYCQDCQRAVETNDGGPPLCFACRGTHAVRTICSGCGRPYDAAKKDLVGSTPISPPQSPWSRLCDDCDHPATFSATKPTAEAKSRYHAVASVYGTIKQVENALETASALQAPGVPTTLHNHPELWSAGQMEAATAWLQQNLEKQ